MFGDILPFILQGIGGALLGPLLSALTGGKGFGFIGNAILGVIGGIGVGQGMNAIGLEDAIGSLMGGGGPMRMLAEVVKGGIGGGILGTIAGMIRRR
ncbi:MAG: hypothetical protein CME88_03125 [Hirschia sp.]|nr:hypothetical protein [Hirschia sp.]|tara:strand:+ start:2074 stop:2364 length:291 start_codon:yes stop_codon:yes gene_type:complete